MINSENGKVKSSGSRFELIFELNAIISHFIEYNPELLLGVFASRKEDLTKAIDTCDNEKLAIADTFSTITYKSMKGVNDERH